VGDIDYEQHKYYKIKQIWRLDKVKWLKLRTENQKVDVAIL